MSCSSASSKPVAKLDWFIENSFNVTDFTFSSYQNDKNKKFTTNSIFKVTNKRKINIEQTLDLTKQNLIGQKYNSKISSFELNSEDSDLKFKQDSLQNSIDYLPEVSVSTLSFSISNEFVRLIENIKDPNHSIKALDNRNSSNGFIKTHQIDEKFVISKLRFADNSYQSSNRKKTYQTANNAIQTIKVKCISRVLHLTMSDEIIIKFIKTNIINETTFTQQQNKSSDRKSQYYNQKLQQPKNSVQSFFEMTKIFQILIIIFTLKIMFNKY